MRIEKCEINRYGKLRNFISSFSSGLNLVKGPNEAGKSTLVDALTDALFENPKTKKKEIKAKTSWGYEQDFSISLDFQSEGLSYSLSKDFDTGEATLIKRSSGETMQDRKRVESLVAESLGLSNRDIFLATSCIQQDEIARIASSPEAIKDRLEALITGGKEEALASKALEKIDNRIKELSKSGYKNKGIIETLESRKIDLEYEVDKATREIEATAVNRTKLKQTQENLTKVSNELVAKLTQTENARKAVDVSERIHELENRFGDLKSRISNIETSESSVKKLRDRLAELPKIDRSDVQTADQQVAQRNYLESKKVAAQEEVEELLELASLAEPGIGIKVSAAAAFVCALGCLAVWYWATAMTQQALLIGAVGALLISGLMVYFWAKRRIDCNQIKNQYVRKQERLDEIIADLKSTNISIKAVLDRCEFKDVESLRDNYENRVELEKEIKTEVRRYEDLLNDKNLKELEDELAEVTRDLAVENEKYRELRVYEISPENLAELESSLKALESGKGKLEADLRIYERHLEFSESGIEHQASLEERLEETVSEIARRKYQLRVLEKTREYIERARKNVLKSTMGSLDEETSEILREITGGKYTQVRFDRQSLKFEVFSDELKDWVEPEGNLSRGTIDQLYLAARLAIVRIISEEKRPVIIMDDPFVTFDAVRRQNAVKFLKRLSDRYQIILLTCHDGYDIVADNVIDLSIA